MRSTITVTITVNGFVAGSFVANRKTYAANDKSNGQTREGWYANGAVSFDRSQGDNVVVTVDGQQHIAKGKMSSSNNWNYNVSGPMVIDGIEYQVGVNVTAKKSPGVMPTGMHGYQVGCNITPRIKAAKGATKGKTKAKAQPAAAKSAPAPVVEQAQPDMAALLARLDAILAGR